MNPKDKAVQPADLQPLPAALLRYISLKHHFDIILYPQLQEKETYLGLLVGVLKQDALVTGNS